jgi:hypothetical protein
MHPHQVTSAPTLSIPIDITWTSSLVALLAVYESGTPKGRSLAKQHLQRMAEVADLAFDAVKTIERMVTEKHVRDDDVLQVVAEAKRLSRAHPCDNTPEHAASPSPAGDTAVACGKLAKQLSKLELPLDICYCARGFYIGTYCDAQPYTRESEEYWTRRELAATALKIGEWTQRTAP